MEKLRIKNFAVRRSGANMTISGLDVDTQAEIKRTGITLVSIQAEKIVAQSMSGENIEIELA